MKRKGGFLLFISACIPGCGEMYQGYMKRGVSLLTSFFLLIALIAMLNLGVLSLLLPVLWLFSFFDTYNLHGQSDEEAAAHPDAWLFGLDRGDDQKLSAIWRKRHSIIGWVLVAIGVYALYDTVLGELLSGLPKSWWWLQDLMLYTIPRSVIILLLIALGIWFIRGPKATPEADFTNFTPPAAAVAATAQPYRDGAPVAPQPPIILGEGEEDAHGDA